MLRYTLFVGLSACLASASQAQNDFVNWETPHVHPLDLTPSGARLLAVNTADNRLEVFDAGGPVLVPLTPVDVGLDPVSVRARTDTEAWVVNHVSDSVSVIDLRTGRVRATLATDDEPCDVVFAGLPERAFVSCSQANSVLVFDPLDLSVAPLRITIEAEDPRAMAVSPDGSEVYVAIFESGNRTTILSGGGTFEDAFPPEVVDESFGPYGGVNPPPNDGANFEPPQNPLNPPPPKVSLIVRKDGDDTWVDDNGEDWTPWVSGAEADESGRPVGWDLADRDVVVIDVGTLGVSYVTGLMNVDMALAVRPTDGLLTVIGTEATNEIRFEPNLTGTFVRVVLAAVDLADPGTSVHDLNPHLDYSVSTIPQNERNRSIGDPRGVVWNMAGTKAYVAGMGSNNVVVVGDEGERIGLAPTIEVGEGPTGVALQEDWSRLYVLDKFEAAISVVDLTTELETERVPFFDPSPVAIRVGRRHLYDTHETSGLGQVSCGACHIDARTDRLAWDLGNPAGDMKSVQGQNLSANSPVLPSPSMFDDFHPMKGPMLTQTLQDIIGKEPFHWRGDKDGLEEFNSAFVGLQGDDEMLTAGEMQEFEDFLATIHRSPNPFRGLDNGLRDDVPLPGHFTTGRFAPAGLPLPNGDATRGSDLFRPPFTLDQNIACATCHSGTATMGTPKIWDGSNFVDFPLGPSGEAHHAILPGNGQTIKIPSLRNVFERSGFNTTQLLSTAGFGYTNDGSLDSVERLVTISQFEPQSDQDVADLLAFIFSISGADLPTSPPNSILSPPSSPIRDAHAAVGAQVTLAGLADAAPETLDVLDELLGLADAAKIGFVAKGHIDEEARGYTYDGGGLWQSDRRNEVLTDEMLRGVADVGAELTFTAVPLGTQSRIGVDRDGDTHLDRDEIDASSDPTDAAVIPGACSDPVPLAPTGLVLTGADVGQVELNWVDTSVGEAGFVVERAPSISGRFSTVALLPADMERFLDIGLECGESYDYRVAAVNCAGWSAYAAMTATAPNCEPLTSDVPSISLSAGGEQNLILRAGVEHAHASYGLVGSALGTAPGFDLGSVHVPLNFDGYFQLTLNLSNSPIFVNTFNLLDDAGEGHAQLALPPGADPILAGLVVNHAFLVFHEPGLEFVSASNAVSLTLVP